MALFVHAEGIRVDPLPSVTTLLRVRLGGAALGLSAPAVREIVRAVAITPLPGAPAIIEGAINVRGRLVGVVDVRGRLGLPARPLDPDQFLVVLSAGERSLAIRVDDVDDLVEVPEEEVGAQGDLSPALRGLAGLAAQADGVLVIYDVEAFVSQAEGEALDAALAAPR
jgi:purine-binding chemotaxis protein CheW